MERLGHATQTVSLRYQHTMSERDQVIAERLAALMRTAAVEPVEPVEPSNVVSLPETTAGHRHPGASVCLAHVAHAVLWN